jgi:hypothetical protein
MGDDPGFATKARHLIDTFARGWSKGRLDLITSIFHEQAIFLETPFGAPIQGREAIRAWASDIPYQQSEIAFTTGEAFTVGPWFATEFKLVFRRRKTGEWVDARGALFAETDGELVTELRMYWHRWNGGRDTSRS